MAKADSVHSTPPTNSSAINPVDRRGDASSVAAGAVPPVSAPRRSCSTCRATLDAELIELAPI